MNKNLDMELLPEAQPCRWNKVAVERFAEKAAQALGYKTGGDISEAVRRLGGKITHDDESDSATGAIEVQGEGDFVIRLSPYARSFRTRFTIAHELGHYMLHSRFGQQPLRVSREGSNRAEWEANWFAAGFLMPEAEFLEKVREGWTDGELALHFDVSEAAAAIRRKTLESDGRLDLQRVSGTN